MKSSMKIHKNSAAFAAAGSILQGIALFSSLPNSLSAQPITPAQDGTNTVILQNGQRFDITGGTQAGANLFQSFQQFGLSHGQIANFLSQPNIQNILSRVVGGDPSVINGLIQVTGGNSNLYIMNPAGIIFGANASLNVPAAFTATTASGIQVGNGWFGINTSANDLKNLTGNPNAFAFTNSTIPISSNGQTGVILNQGNLTASQGQTITLVGGIVINTGTISTPNGKINIVAVPDGKYVKITPEGGVLSLELPIATQQELGATRPLTALDLPKLLTGSGITAPTMAGEAIATGQLSAGNINILANRYNTSQASLNAANIQQGWNLVFVDATVKNYQTLIDGTKGGSSVTVINPDQYGIQKITTTLADITGANSLHIVSEGDAGNFWLGKDFVSSENIANYSTQLQAWRTSLSPAATILLYACNLANGENGVALVQAVRNYTGREVAASTDRTGSTALGGNWNLEYQTGKTPATLIISAAATQAYQNSLLIYTVTNQNDSGVGSLRAQIATANGTVGIADEIRFSFSGIPIVLSGGEIAITDALTISGNGRTNTIIDGNNTNRIFNITGTTPVTIDGVTLRNGNIAGGDGGAIFSDGGTLTITNSTLSGNRSTTVLGIGGAGGAILRDTGGSVTISNSTISGNSAAGGGGVLLRGITSINNSIVSGNTSSGLGGGIVVNGALTLTNSTVSGNTATGGRGGGIFTLNGTTTISNSALLNNTSSNEGGGIYAFNAASYTNTTVSGNTSTSGGGIYGNGAVTLTNSTVSGNTVTGGNGGGIYGNTTVTATNSTISGNRADSFGGGIYAETSFNLTNTTISGNATNTFGGGIFSNNGGAIASSTITKNIADADNDANGDGGGIFSNNGTVTIINSIVAGNSRGLLVQDLGSNTAPAGFTNSGNNLIGANNGFAVTFPVSTLVGTIAAPVDPKLAALGNYGGSTQTHALLPGSVALNAGNNAGVPATDQRGAARISGGTVDIGAFESLGFSLTPLANTTPQSTLVNTNFANLLGVQVTENFANSAVSIPNILVTFTPSSSGASGLFAGNANILTNNLGIAVAPTFTANGLAGSHTVSATATGFNAATFSLTNTPVPTSTPSPTPTPKPRDGFGGSYPSGDDIGTDHEHNRRHHRHRRHSLRLDDEDRDDVREHRNFRRLLCLKGSLATARTTSIPTCKD